MEKNIYSTQKKKQNLDSSSKYAEKNEKLKALIFHSQNNNEDSMEEIILMNEDTILGVFKILERNTKSRLYDYKEDLLQEARMGIVDAVRTYNPDYYPTIIVEPLTHIHNKCYAKMLKYFRSVCLKDFSFMNIDDSEVTDSDNPMFGYIEKNILNQMVNEEVFREMLNRLSPREKNVLVYKYWWGFKNLDIALVLGISTHTVKKRFRTAKKKLISEFDNIEEWFNGD